jgi:hypothetical protein
MFQACRLVPMAGYGLGNSVGNSWSTCLQSNVSAYACGADLPRWLSVSSRGLPLATPGNGTLMARRPWRARVQCPPDKLPDDADD